MKSGAVLSCTLALPLSVGAAAELRIESRLDTAQGCFALFQKLDVKGDRRISRDEATAVPPTMKAFNGPAVGERGYLTPKEFLNACTRARRAQPTFG
jgi:hypothetical protein